MAAPTRNHFVRVDPLVGSLPNRSFTSCWIIGMRVWPPTSTTSLISRLHAGILERLLAGLDRTLKMSSTICFQLGAGQLS